MKLATQIAVATLVILASSVGIQTLNIWLRNKELEREKKTKGINK